MVKGLGFRVRSSIPIGVLSEILALPGSEERFKMIKGGLIWVFGIGMGRTRALCKVFSCACVGRSMK